MDALYSHTAKDAAAFASSYYGFAENLTQEVVCDAGDVVIFTEALTQYVVPLALSVFFYLQRTRLTCAVGWRSLRSLQWNFAMDFGPPTPGLSLPLQREEYGVSDISPLMIALYRDPKN